MNDEAAPDSESEQKCSRTGANRASGWAKGS
jgi:hypothetical protein